MKNLLVKSLSILLISLPAFADNYSQDETIPDRIQKSIDSHPEQPSIRETLPSDTCCIPSQQSSGDYSAPPSDAPTREEMEQRSEPAPRQQEIFD